MQSELKTLTWGEILRLAIFLIIVGAISNYIAIKMAQRLG